MTAFYRRMFGARPIEGPKSVPSGYRVYAIGDVHGRVDLLDEILAAIDRDSNGRGRAKTIIVLLGDLIDRGPASAQVIERVRTYRRPGTRMIHLCGNHEEVLLRLLDGDPAFLEDWLRFGGAECVASYGVDPESLKLMKGADAIARIKSVIPSEHQRFLRSLGDTFTIGSYVFVHAGLRPGVALDEQSQLDLRWIREPFLGSDEPHGLMVIHGHTITEQAEVRSNRIGIDTGAYRTGVLTALGLEGDDRWFLQTAPAASAA